MKDRRKAGISRRRFLKTTAVGALALSGLPTVIIPRRVEAYQAGARIHPNLDPLRVVGLSDPRMTTDQALTAATGLQDQLVAADVVAENIDRLALALAEEGSVGEAWKKILIKPAAKSWSDVVVAIKTNQIAQQRTRVPVMSKLCHVLTDVVGVKGENIFIYDACHGGGLTREGRFTDLPEGVNVADKWGGYNTRVPVSAPYHGGNSQSQCLDHLARDEVDILINIALCKGHGGEFGSFTMAMKNHFGTFIPSPAHGQGGGADYLIGINKTPQILGRMDPATGSVLFPRQQLVLIDALWASQPGPGGNPTAQPNALVMGTTGFAVDYLTALRLRRDEMGWRVNENVAARFLSEFGFSADQMPGGGQIVDAMAAVA